MSPLTDSQNDKHPALSTRLNMVGLSICLSILVGEIASPILVGEIASQDVLVYGEG